MRLSSKTITYEQLAKVIDHSLLRPELTEADVLAGCELAARYHVATVCVKPSDVKLAKEALKDSDVIVSTVVGFPHGSSVTAIKVGEAQQAMDDGALELANRYDGRPYEEADAKRLASIGVSVSETTPDTRMATSSTSSHATAVFSHRFANGRRKIGWRSERQLYALKNWIRTSVANVSVITSSTARPTTRTAATMAVRINTAGSGCE